MTTNQINISQFPQDLFLACCHHLTYEEWGKVRRVCRLFNARVNAFYAQNPCCDYRQFLPKGRWKEVKGLHPRLPHEPLLDCQSRMLHLWLNYKATTAICSWADTLALTPKPIDALDQLFRLAVDPTGLSPWNREGLEELIKEQGTANAALLFYYNIQQWQNLISIWKEKPGSYEKNGQFREDAGRWWVKRGKQGLFFISHPAALKLLQNHPEGSSLYLAHRTLAANRLSISWVDSNIPSRWIKQGGALVTDLTANEEFLFFPQKTEGGWKLARCSTSQLGDFLEADSSYFVLSTGNCVTADPPTIL